ncbi:MAG: hypothetical protein FWC69_05690 [Defluviitaleaceae bacterium]|nr:hypothetical protein [Defluviitaleaceae bacterium]
MKKGIIALCSAIILATGAGLIPPPPPAGTILNFVDNEDDVPYGADFAITESFELHFPHIAQGDVIVLGNLNIEPGQAIEVSLEVEEGRGFFVGRSDHANAGQVGGRFMFEFAASITISPRQVVVEYTRQGGRYLYIGSTYPMHPAATDLYNVNVRVDVRSTQEQQNNDNANNSNDRDRRLPFWLRWFL